MADLQVLYCDESGIHKGGSFFFGALIGSPRRFDILRNSLVAVRKTHNFTREMKWNNVRLRELEVYRDFVRVFFEDPYAYFKMMEVVKGINWKGWGRTGEERFFKSYYVFLRRQMRPMCRYGIYLDYKSGKPYRWEKLYFAINNASKRDYDLRQKHIHTLKPLNSRDEDLIQLADLLLGSITCKATAIAKTALASYVQTRSLETTKSGKQKIVSEIWNPKIQTQ